MSEYITSFDRSSRTITGFSKTFSGALVLERTYENVDIKVIGSNAARSAEFTTVDLRNTVITTIQLNGFYHCLSLTTLILPDTIETLALDSFRMANITSLHIPPKLKNFDGAFNMCHELDSFTIDPNNPYLKVENNIVYSYDYSRLIRAAVSTQFEDITKLDSVTELVSYCFSYTKIKKFKGSNKITLIGDGTFEQCYGLADVNLVQTSITTICSYSFKNSIINFLILPPKIKVIEEAAFDGCNVTSLFLPSSITDIGTNAFQNQKGDLKVFYFAANSFNDRVIFSSKTNTIEIFVPLSYKYTTLAGLPVTVCSIDEMFVPEKCICTKAPCLRIRGRLTLLSYIFLYK